MTYQSEIQRSNEFHAMANALEKAKINVDDLRMTLLGEIDNLTQDPLDDFLIALAHLEIAQRHLGRASRGTRADAKQAAEAA